MSRSARIACAALMLAGGLFAARLTLPSRTVACSCRGPGPVAEVKGDPNAVVVLGTVLSIEGPNDASGHSLGQFAIQRLFQGPALPGQVPIVSGGGGDCTIRLEQRWQLVMVARFGEGRLQPGLCGHFGLITTPEGLALLRDAEAAFGSGVGPAPPPAAQPGDQTIDLALVAILLVLSTVVAAIFGVAILVVGRRGRAGMS